LIAELANNCSEEGQDDDNECVEAISGPAANIRMMEALKPASFMKLDIGTMRQIQVG
jgi:hypothetical protein